jgi:methyl-accepting chemotaxis protein
MPAFIRASLSVRVFVLSALLVAGATLAVAVGAVWVIGGKIATDATTSQNVNLRVAVATLERAIPGLEARYGREGDITRLEAPSLPDFESHEIIDSVGRQTGETSTVFIWDESQRDFVRRTTNITRPDGTRAVGTVLGAGAVYDAMMAGQSFRGEAVILGTPYYTAYQPVFSTSGDVIGIIYVGVERAKIVAVRNQVITVMAVVGVLAFLLAAAAAYAAVNSAIGPLRQLESSVDRISAGDYTDQVAGQSREDEIGRIAKAIVGLQSTLTEADRLRAENEARNEARLKRAEAMSEAVETFQSRADTLLTDVRKAAEEVSRPPQARATPPRTASAAAKACRAQLARPAPGCRPWPPPPRS